MYDNYLVKKSDTIESISKKYNISPEILFQLNGPNFMFSVGRTIKVPHNNNSCFVYYTVAKGDTLFKIAKEKGIDAKLLSQLNGLNIDDFIYPNQVLLVPKPGIILYFTAIGDTLSEVLKGLKISCSTLLKQNSNIYLQPEQLIVYKYSD